VSGSQPGDASLTEPTEVWSRGSHHDAAGMLNPLLAGVVLRVLVELSMSSPVVLPEDPVLGIEQVGHAEQETLFGSHQAVHLGTT
jgi:hypothetical protein